jgi:molybdopterin converting factor subunit 1
MTTPSQPPLQHTINIRVLFFASAREAAQTSETSLQVDSNCDTRQLRTILADAYPSLTALIMDEESITFALNEEYVLEGQAIALKEGDTVALIPPISGG